MTNLEDSVWVCPPGTYLVRIVGCGGGGGGRGVYRPSNPTSTVVTIPEMAYEIVIGRGGSRQ